ncbi:MAG: hypothetical protein P1P76_11255 [Anaerolineales bacterium]|nr:hypothetical protein [Anaerolineales bacterium]
MNGQDQHAFDEEFTPDISSEPGSDFAALIRKLILGFLALIVILSMLSNLIALPETGSTPSRSDIGLTEADIVERYGPPDERSGVQVVGVNDMIGLAPRRLDQGEKYFDLRYEEGPLILIFHFVSPDTFRKYNAYSPDADDWIVLERAIGTRTVIY